MRQLKPLKGLKKDEVLFDEMSGIQLTVVAMQGESVLFAQKAISEAKGQDRPRSIHDLNLVNAKAEVRVTELNSATQRLSDMGISFVIATDHLSRPTSDASPAGTNEYRDGLNKLVEAAESYQPPEAAVA